MSSSLPRPIALVPALLAVLPALASAQGVSSASIGAAASSARHDFGQVSSSLSIIPKGGSMNHGLVLASWIDPSFVALGSMTGQLYDKQGELEYDLVATVSEYLASGSGQRFGGISGELYQAQVPTGIQVSGMWTIDLATNTGSFDVDVYLGGFSPTAPILALGSMDGRLSKPKGLSQGGGQGTTSIKIPTTPGQVSASLGSESEVSVQSSGSKAKAGGISGQKLVVRKAHGRWVMI